jgi:hypothetical protein
VEEILHQAEQSEKEYDWVGAAGSYEKALKLLPEDDFSRMGQIYERLGTASYRAAFQAERREEFRQRLQSCIMSYDKAATYHEKSEDLNETASMFRCKAMPLLANYWSEPETSKKKRFLEEFLNLVKKASALFEKAGNTLEYGRTFNLAFSAVDNLFNLEWDVTAGKKLLDETIRFGENAATLLSHTIHQEELAKTCVKLSYLTTNYAFILSDFDEKSKWETKSVDYWKTATRTSEEVALLQLPSGSNGLAVNWDLDVLIQQYEKALSYLGKTRDKYLIGMALSVLAYGIYSKSMTIEDPDKKKEMLEKALIFAQDSERNLSVILYTSPINSFAIGDTNQIYFWELASMETDKNRKRDYLLKSIAEGTKAIALAEKVGYPNSVETANHVHSKVLMSLAKTETASGQKKELLEKALAHRTKAIEVLEKLGILDYWDSGLGLNYLADLEAELAEFERSIELRANMLRKAISNKERGIELLKKGMKLEPLGHAGSVHQTLIAGYQYAYSGLLESLYQLTKDDEFLRKAIKVLEEAIQNSQRADTATRTSECQWKLARCYDALGQHLKAAEYFGLAANSYVGASKKIPKLKEFYQNFGLYMQAWSEIEKARHHHAEQNYSLAKQHFEKAADIHRSLKQWSYLSSNYLAWAKVEQAEEMSRKEETEEAVKAFEKATDLFVETKKCLEMQLDSLEDMDEKRMVVDMIKATDLRSDYCKARIALEEAKSLDKQGAHHLSSEKYRSAANTLGMIGQALESIQEQKEMKFISVLANAWQKMAEAEAEESPQHFAEASRLFEVAKSLGQGEKIKALVLGHSRFCLALEAGARFADTRDVADYARALQHLESASGYYLKANSQSASDYVKATRFLFDAYVQMGNAAREADPEKKTRVYMVAEKVLQASADSYGKAGNPSRKEQALKLLKTVQEQREMAISLMEVLRAPIIGSTAAFAAPLPTSEKAVGLERFEHAEVNANLILSQRELRVGESVDLEIELANPGKGQALLTQIEEAFPESFDLTTKPESYRVEGHNINMKGRRLDPLKTEEVKFSVKPKRKGAFTVRPRILYLDENGKVKSHQPQPLTITVKELGISGWIKGER